MIRRHFRLNPTAAGQVKRLVEHENVMDMAELLRRLIDRAYERMMK